MDIKEMESKLKLIDWFTDIGRKAFNDPNMTLEQMAKRIDRIIYENEQMRQKIKRLENA